jgi:hypothetical protein
LNEGEKTEALSTPLGLRSLFCNKLLPWPLDASVPLLDMFHVVRFPFIHSSTGEELLTVIVSLGCFETCECFMSFDMNMFWPFF